MAPGQSIGRPRILFRPKPKAYGGSSGRREFRGLPDRRTTAVGFEPVPGLFPEKLASGVLAFLTLQHFQNFARRPDYEFVVRCYEEFCSWRAHRLADSINDWLGAD
jgi:hypothetical protein